MPSKFLAIDTETTGTRLFHGCKPFAVSMCTDRGGTSFWEWPVNPHTRQPIIPDEDKDEIQRRIDNAPVIVMHNAKFDVRSLSTIGIKVPWSKIEDTLPLSHVLASGDEHGLKPLCQKYLGIPDDDESALKEAIKVARRQCKDRDYSLAETTDWDGWLPKHLDPKSQVLKTYSIQDAKRTALLWAALHKILLQEGPKFQEKYHREKQIAEISYQMEHRGATLRPRALSREISKYHAVAKAAECYVVTKAKGEGLPDFNVRSTKQLRELLFDRYKLPVLSYTNGGEASTDADTLDELFERYPKHKLLSKLLEHRNGAKAHDYLCQYRDLAISYALHASINPWGTGTTRFSVNDPNLQNVGKKAKMPLRVAFGPPANRCWICADYSQLELRILAHAAPEPRMQEVFDNDGDVHQQTADLTDIARKQAKNVNYAIIYGAGPSKLGAMCGVPDIGERFKNAYPGVNNFFTRSTQQARTCGYVETLMGYRLYTDHGRPYTGANYIIQGTAGDILKYAMVNLWNSVLVEHDVHMILTIHDELVFDCPRIGPKGFFNFVCGTIRDCMEEPARRIGLRTPVDLSVVNNGWDKPRKIRTKETV